MPVQARRRNVKFIGSAVAALAALAVVNPVTVGSAHADPDSPKVNLVVTASCGRFANDSVPNKVTVTTATNPAEKKSKTIDADEESATFGALKFLNIPKAGTLAKVTVVCEDPDGADDSFTKQNVKIKRPAGDTLTQKISVS
ncbi:hypothetical protein OG985_20735 [Streptomyces sp. NBC_00289]|uniref:hypothetical protein n=1 Tax=Streptomyces sp. NBC_00289 TaxID=2975703 RepID=UPI00324A7D9F